jgi:adenosylcobinamide-GDP ribazoletransferase
MLVASARAAVGAVTFLTRVPLPRVAAVGGEDVARGSALFPLVGAGVGAVGGGVALLAHLWLPPFLSAAFGCAVVVVLSGALHVDALADTVDAIGATTRERALEIMRDPRIGSFGAAAITVDLLARAAAIAALVDGGVIAALVVAGALGRAAALPLAAALPYARASGGVLTGRVGWVAAVGGGATAVAFALALRGVDGLAAVAAALVTAALLAAVFRRWLGGVTGDTLGATTELAGLVALLTLTAS